MRYLALDVGDRRIGLAVGDDAHGLARPLRTLVRRSVVKDLAELERIARAEEVDALVIGADAFLTKPVDFERLGWVVRVIANFGWAIVKLRA